MPLKISHRVKRILRADAPYKVGTRLLHSDPKKGKFWGQLVYDAKDGLKSNQINISSADTTYELSRPSISHIRAHHRACQTAPYQSLITSTEGRTVCMKPL